MAREKVMHCLLLSGNAGRTASDALMAILKIQLPRSVLRSLSILTEDLVDETPVNIDLPAEDLLVYRVLACA